MNLRRSKSGFTLLELMVVMLFLAIIGVYTWTYLRTTIKTQKSIEDKTAIQQVGLSLMSRLQDDISQVFFVESYQKLAYFNGDAKSLSFTSLSHDAPNPDDRECEEAEITYSLDSDPDNSDTQVLLRKEVPFLDGELERNDEFQPIIVAHQIASLEFAYSDDGSKFTDEWNAANTDHLNKLPKLVRIKITVKDQDDREEYFETLIDLPMTENLNVTAATPGKTPPGTPGAPDNPATPSTKSSTPSNTKKGGGGGIQK